jgi:cytochrome b
MRQNSKILVWDAPTRVFHWMLAFCFAGAYVTSESDRWLGVHLTLGYTMVGLVAFRLVWGLVGTRYARFSSFIRGPAAVTRYAASMIGGLSEKHVGHNPLGAVSIVLMLALTLAVVYTGWVTINGGAHLLKELHEGAAGLMLAIVVVHVAAVLLSSLMQGENLPRSMLSGMKEGLNSDGIRWSWWPLAVVIVACVLGFWFLQAQSPTPIGAGGGEGDWQQGGGKHNSKHNRQRFGGDDD